MLKYSKDELKSFKLTHVLFTNISTNDDDEDRIRRLFERDLPLKVEAAHYMGLIPISVYTNLYSFYKQPGIFNHYLHNNIAVHHWHWENFLKHIIFHLHLRLMTFLWMRILLFRPEDMIFFFKNVDDF